MSLAGGLTQTLSDRANETATRAQRERLTPESEVELRSAAALKSDETTIIDVADILPPVTRTRPRRKPSNTTAAAPAPARTSATPNARPRKPHKQSQQNAKLKRVGVPLILSLGVVMLLPGCWAIAQLAGFEVFKHDDAKAGQMAYAMLTTFPLSLALIAGAIYIHITARRQPQAQARKRSAARR